MSETNVRLEPDERQVLAERITPEQLTVDMRRYSGLHSRHAWHHENPAAVAMLEGDLRRIGQGKFEVKAPEFSLAPYTLYNVEASLAGPRKGVVVVSAHLDSTAELETPYIEHKHPAPGADDDASGIAGVLAAARALRRLAEVSKLRRREIRFVLFNAEERRRVGSKAYATACRLAGIEIVGVYQLDMIGYDHDGVAEFELHAGYSNDRTVQDESVKIARVVASLCPVVSPNLVPQLYTVQPGPDGNPQQSLSDHTSFHEAGYAACLATQDCYANPESDDPTTDCNRFVHRFRDTMENINAIYATDIARVVTAAAWHLATR